MPVSGDRLIHVHRTHGGIAGRFQPSGDSHRAAHLTGVSTGTGHPDDDRRLEPVDRVGADAQQARTLSVNSGGQRRLARGRPGNRSSARGPEGASRHAITVTDAGTGLFTAPVGAGPMPGRRTPVVRSETTMLRPCGPGTPCRPQWCSTELSAQRCGLTRENLVTPVGAGKSSAAWSAAHAWVQRVPDCRQVRSATSIRMSW